MDENFKNNWIKALKKTVLALLQINVNFVLSPRNICLIYFLETSHTSSKKFWTGAF